MRDDPDDYVIICDDLEIKAVISVDPTLPDIVALVVLFRLDRRMPQVAAQQVQLLSSARLEVRRQVGKVPPGTRREADVHWLENRLPSSVLSHASNSFILLNDGDTRPARTSSSPSASAASIAGCRSTISLGVSTMRCPSRATST